MRGQRRDAQPRGQAIAARVARAASAAPPGCAKIATARNVRPHRPITETRSARATSGPRQRIAEGVPGKPGQQMAAQPFGDRQRDRERQNAQRAARPDQRARARARAPVIEREIGRQPGTANGSSQAKVLASTRKAWPIQYRPGDEIAEAEPPAGDRGRSDAAEAAGGRRHRSARPGPGRSKTATGQRSNGGSASADAAPAAARSAPRRQPQARMMRVGKAGRASRPVRSLAAPGSGDSLTRFIMGRGHCRREPARARRRWCVRRRPSRSARVAARSRRAAVDPHPLDPARIGIEHLDFERPGPGTSSPRTGRRPIWRHQIAAERVDFVRRLADVEFRADDGGDVFEAGARIGEERAVGLPHDRRRARPRRARRRCRRRSARRCPRSTPGRRCRHIRRPPAPDGCASPASCASRSIAGIDGGTNSISRTILVADSGIGEIDRRRDRGRPATASCASATFRRRPPPAPS